LTKVIYAETILHTFELESLQTSVANWRLWKFQHLLLSLLSLLSNNKSRQNYWVSGLFPSSGILENTTFRKLQLYPLERANLNEVQWSSSEPIKAGLCDLHPVCVSVYAWTNLYETWYVYYGTSKAYFIDPISLCILHIVARQRLGIQVPASMNTR
jgi:hypothetical protein